MWNVRLIVCALIFYSYAIDTYAVEECQELGIFLGEVSAKVFCELSKQVGHTARFAGMNRVPKTVCGEIYTISCESSFVTYAKAKCPKYAKGAAFENYYRASQNGCCSYNPSPQ